MYRVSCYHSIGKYVNEYLPIDITDIIKSYVSFKHQYFHGEQHKCKGILDQGIKIFDEDEKIRIINGGWKGFEYNSRFNKNKYFVTLMIKLTDIEGINKK